MDNIQRSRFYLEQCNGITEYQLSLSLILITDTNQLSEKIYLKKTEHIRQFYVRVSVHR